MNYSPIFALEIVVGIAALFALVIFFGLQFRKRKFARSLELRAVDIWPQIEVVGFDFAGLLYGVRQDFSATQLAMIVKDSRDQQVARWRSRTQQNQWSQDLKNRPHSLENRRHFERGPVVQAPLGTRILPVPHVRTGRDR